MVITTRRQQTEEINFSGDLIVDGLVTNDPKVGRRLIRQKQQFYSSPAFDGAGNVINPLRAWRTRRGGNHAAGRLAERATTLSAGDTCALAVKTKMMLFDELTSVLDLELREVPKAGAGPLKKGRRW